MSQSAPSDDAKPSRGHRTRPTARRPRQTPMTEDSGANLIRELVRALPLLLDDGAIEELARRLRPHLALDQPIVESNDQLLTSAEAANRARVNIETVRRAIRAGELPVAARIGRSPRITRLALERWLAETGRRPESPQPIRRRKAGQATTAQEYSLIAALRTHT
jgi:excisionase family DNA binding protein